MKRFIAAVLCFAFILLMFSFPASAEEKVYYAFEGEESIQTVTSSLASGGSAVYTSDGFLQSGLALNGTYGVYLGEVTDTFSVSAMVKITSSGDTDTIFFKNMGTASNQKWTGIQSRAGKAALWTNGAGYSWTTVAAAESAELSSWANVVYVENAGVGSLYVNGALVGSGGVVKDSGSLYLGATYWQADAPSGTADEVKLYDYAVSKDEVTALYDEYARFTLSLPSEVTGDISLPAKLGTKSLTWVSSNEDVITSGGAVTRGDEDVTVTLTAYSGEELVARFEVTVLKKPVIVNDSVILSYKFEENSGDIIRDSSGNGNHGAANNGLSITEDGAYFDGTDDFVRMPEGVLYGHDNITIIFTAKPEAAKSNIFAYCFGNSSTEGYMFLNTSRPTTNTLRFAMTKASYSSEKAVASVPGIRAGEWGTAAVTLEGSEAKLYLDGEIVMSGNLGMTVSELGMTQQNYIGKSLYSGDPYFKGTVREFTVLNYAMSTEEIKEAYAKTPEYAEEEREEYIQALSFDGGIEGELDTYGRDDVYIAAAAVDENGNITKFSVAKNAEELNTEGENIIVFAFNEENNIPGRIYMKGTDGKISYEYTPGKVCITNNDRDFIGGVAIIALYDASGALACVTLRTEDVLLGDVLEINGDFDSIASVKLLYWNSVASLQPAD